MGASITEISLGGLTPMRRGKVRDVYETSDGRLIIVATDRISAYDTVLPSGIPDKGTILTQLSAFWFERVSHIVTTHFITCEVEKFPLPFPSYSSILSGRSMLVWKAERLDFECVVRGYLAGSAWQEYCENRTIAGEIFGPGLREADKFERPVFTPSRKSVSGHDESLSFADFEREVGSERANELKATSLRLYAFGSDYCGKRGLILADSKFEFGLKHGSLMLIDELFSPDSSRFWPMDMYEPGRPQESFDKQFVRDYLRSTGWNKEPPPPPLPQEIVEKTRQRYLEAVARICGTQRENT